MAGVSLNSKRDLDFVHKVFSSLFESFPFLCDFPFPQKHNNNYFVHPELLPLPVCFGLPRGGEEREKIR